MGVSSVRDVVIVPFPFSDLSQTKIRPAVCIAPVEREEWSLCAVTSTGQGDPNAISIGPTDFESGGLRHHSFVRPLKIFTAHERRFIRSAGTLNEAALKRIIDTLIGLLRP